MKTEQATPPKVSREAVRKHFQEVYSLSGQQIEKMLASSAQSLRTFLSALAEVTAGEADLAEIVRLSHGLKGVLLNMGQDGWAEWARDLERTAAAGENRNYEKVVATIRLGVEEVIEESDP